jgi:hypothetical protein
MARALDVRTAIAAVVSPASAPVRSIASALFLLADDPVAAPLAAALHWHLHGERAAALLWHLHHLRPPVCGACTDLLALLTTLATGVPRGCHLLDSDAKWALSIYRESLATWSLPWFDVSRCLRAAGILACLEPHTSQAALLAAAGHNALAGHRAIWCEYCTSILAAAERQEAIASSL